MQSNKSKTPIILPIEDVTDIYNNPANKETGSNYCVDVNDDRNIDEPLSPKYLPDRKISTFLKYIDDADLEVDTKYIILLCETIEKTFFNQSNQTHKSTDMLEIFWANITHDNYYLFEDDKIDIEYCLIKSGFINTDIDPSKKI